MECHQRVLRHNSARLLGTPVIRGGARSGIPSAVAEGLYARGQLLKLGCKHTSTFQSLLEQISIMFNYSGGFQSGKAPPRAN